MPPPGFQFPGAGFQAGSGLRPRRPAGQDYQDYLEGVPRSSHGEKDIHAGVAGSEPEERCTVSCSLKLRFRSFQDR